MSKRKHTTLTLKEKLDALKRLDNGENLFKLATELGVGKATIWDWKKNRVKLQQSCATSLGKALSCRQTLKQSHYDKVDKALFLWITQERERGIALNGPMIQEKAVYLNKLMNGDESFSASSGWLDRFRKRHGIRGKLTISVENHHSDRDAAEGYLSEFEKLLEEGNYSPQQIYNADETGLYFRTLPKKSLQSKAEEHAPDFKMSQDRVTVLACSNAAGDHKLPLMIIGKSARPRAFKNCNIKSLPVYYCGQKDGKFFKEWFHDEFVPSAKHFFKENNLPSRAMLLIDNSPSHRNIEELCDGEIVAKFIPSNDRPILQDVLQTIKRIYRKQFLRKLIEDDGISLVDKIRKTNIKDVVYWLAEAWQSVSVNTLKKSRRNLWTSFEFQVNPVENDEENLLQIVKIIPGCEEASEIDVEEWMAADGSNWESLTDGDIVAHVAQDHLEEACSEGSEIDDNLECDKEELVSHSAAAEAFHLALRYLKQQATVEPADLVVIKRWRNFASNKTLSSLCQNPITKFLSSKQEQ